MGRVPSASFPRKRESSKRRALEQGLWILGPRFRGDDAWDLFWAQRKYCSRNS